MNNFQKLTIENFGLLWILRNKILDIKAILQYLQSYAQHE